jgi:hypothetical protein
VTSWWASQYRPADLNESPGRLWTWQPQSSEGVAHIIGRLLRDACGGGKWKRELFNSFGMDHSPLKMF